MSSWNENAIAEFHANNGVTKQWGRSLILMHTTGAKSGEKRVTPAMGFRNDHGWFVVASKGGAPENPAWYYNLLANPSFDVEALVGDAVQTARVTARELDGDEYDAAWEQITTKVPAFEEYKKNTARRLPILLLER